MTKAGLALLVLSVLLGGCATTEVMNTWKDPQHAGTPLRKVLVVGISNQASVRRAFEDTFAKSLADAGVTAVASHTLVAKDGQIPEDVLQKAVADAGADGVLITRMVGRQTDLQVMPSPMPPPIYGARRYYYGYYTGAWAGYYEPATVQTYRYIVAETTVFRADNAEPAWSATTRTQEPKDVAKATEGFAKVMIPALRKDGVI
jgi:hypothetical protein